MEGYRNKLGLSQGNKACHFIITRGESYLSLRKMSLAWDDLNVIQVQTERIN